MPGVAEFGVPLEPGEHRYTAMVGYPGSLEEIDVNASSEKEARRIAEQELEENYQPGWKSITIVGPRVGFYT